MLGTDGKLLNRPPKGQILRYLILWICLQYFVQCYSVINAVDDSIFLSWSRKSFKFG